ANLLWALLFAAAFGVSMAGAVQIGRSLGAGDIPSAKAAIGATVFACALVSVLCIVPMVVGAREMLELLGTPTVSVPQGVRYLRILLLSVPLIDIYGAVMAALRAA